jgi:hypothetical protein
MNSASVHRVLCIAACAVLSGFSPPAKVWWEKVWWAKELNLVNLSDIDAALGKPFDERVNVVSGSNRASVGNCAEYLKYSDQGYKPASDFELRVLESLGADCRALALLKNAAPAKVSYLADFRLDKSAPAQLPAQFAVSVSPQEVRSAAAAERAGKSWQQYQPELKLNEGSTGLRVEAGGMRSDLQLYARGDFNGDGIEDLLIRDDFAALQGTYAGTRLFLLTRRSGQRVLEVLKEYD